MRIIAAALAVALALCGPAHAASFRAMSTTSVQSGDVVANTVTKTELTTAYAIAPDGNFPFSATTGQGKTLEIHAKGAVSTTGTPTLTVTIDQVSSSPASTYVLGTTGAVTLGSGLSNAYWQLDATCVWSTTGPSGIATCIGALDVTVSGAITRYPMTITPNTGTTGWTTSVNTYQSNRNYLSVGITWGTASASNTITMQMLNCWPTVL